MDLGLRDRVAIVTGGSAGIGRACALALAQEGAHIAICARSADRLNETAEAITRQTDRRVLPLVSDLRQPDQIIALTERAAAEFGRIDILVNNAGAARYGPPLEIDDAAWLSVFELKYMGYLRCARAVAPHMIRLGWGRIVNIIGTGGKRVSSFHLPGGSVNAALVLLTKGLGLELAPYGLLVNAVSPAGVPTESLGRLMQARAESAGVNVEEAWGRTVAQFPLGRPARAEEVAAAVCFLASERASYFVGTTLWMDGGVIDSV